MLSDVQWGYCQECGKEVPIAEGLLESHYLDGNYPAMNKVTGYPVDRIACVGYKPSPMPEGGVCVKYAFTETPFIPVGETFSFYDQSARRSVIEAFARLRHLPRITGGITNGIC